MNSIILVGLVVCVSLLSSANGGNPFDQSGGFTCDNDQTTFDCNDGSLPAACCLGTDALCCPQCGTDGSDCSPPTDSGNNAPLNSDISVCRLPKKVGKFCKDEDRDKTFRRWYYDSDEKKCKSFRYKGCKGNQNNFDSLSDCKLKCKRKMDE